MRNLLLLLNFVLCIHVYAGQLTGKVIDENKLSLDYCNIILHQNNDSTYLNGTTTDSNGVFILEDIKNGQYFLEVTNLGYRIDTILNIIVNENNIDLGIIQLMPEAELLGEVVIKATRPVIERLPDRTIFNVENSVKSAGQNTLELLRSVPGVTVSGNNQIMINGKKDIQVMINGKVEMMNGDQLANLLKSIQSSNIKKIEVISNPSAKYDASAKGGILNIVLKTSLRTGISGSIFSNYAQNKYWGNQTGTNININYKKFFMGINYSYAHNNLSLDNYIQRKFNKDTSIQVFTDNGTDRHTEKVHFGYINLGYNINEKHKLALKGQLSNFVNPHNNNTLLTILSDESSNTFQEYQQTNNTSEINNFNPSGTLNYTANLDSNGVLDFAFDFAKFKNNNNSNLFTRFLDDSNTEFRLPLQFSQRNPFLVDIYVYNINYQKPINAKNSIELGHKFTWTHSENDIKFYNIEEGISTLDILRSNVFEYTENINAGYFIWNGSWKNDWKTNVGLRVEQTNANQYSKTLDERTIRHYIDFFPSVFAQKSWKEKHNISINYSRKIKRPAFKDLNPFQFYNSQYYIWSGNAQLLPEYADISEIAYTFDNTYTFTIGHEHQKNSSTYLAFQDDVTNITKYVASNFRKRNNLYISAMLNKDITEWWYVSAGFQYTFFRYNAQASNNELLNLSSNKVNLNVDNTFSLPKDFKINLFAFYDSRFLDATDLMRPSGMVNVSISKSFFDNQFQVALFANDIFHTLNFSFDTDFANINSVIENRWNSRFVGVSLTYHFKKGKQFENNRIKSSSEEEKNRVG